MNHPVAGVLEALNESIDGAGPALVVFVRQVRRPRARYHVGVEDRPVLGDRRSQQAELSVVAGKRPANTNGG